MSTRKTTSRTVTTVETRREVSPLGRPEALSWQEEMVVRMRRGLSEDADFALEFRGGRFADTRLKLALLEGDALQWLRDEQARREEGASLPPTEAGAEEKVRAALRGIARK